MVHVALASTVPVTPEIVTVFPDEYPWLAMVTWIGPVPASVILVMDLDETINPLSL